LIGPATPGLDVLGSAAWKNVATAVASAETGLTTGKQVYDAIQAIGHAVRFVGVAPLVSGKTAIESVEIAYPAASQEAGSVAVCDGSEFICYKKSGESEKTWDEFGNASVYLLKTEAQATYTPLTRTIAGVDLQDNVTAAELETALGLGALAKKASATGNVTTVDSAKVTAAKADTYAVSSQTVTIPDTYNALDVTPEGTVSITKSTGAAVAYDKVKAVSIASSAPAETETPNYTPAGTVSKPAITVTHAADTTSAFATSGITAAMDSTDTEMLVLSAASTGNAVTAVGALSAALDANPAFTGTGTMLKASATTESKNATVTDAVYTAAFTGTEASVTPTVLATRNATVTAGSVTVGSDEFTCNLTTSAKTVTVS